MTKALIYTIGHSTRTLNEFLDLLQTYKIEQLIDVRTIAKSRHNPQFNEAALSINLQEQKISYSRNERLGGLRYAKKDSINIGWRNASFRGYADYMQTEDFFVATKLLISAARNKMTVIMCAEALPWRCHRSMIADVLVRQKFEVRHIMSKTSAPKHKLTSFAKVKKGKLYYPGIKIVK